MNLVKVCIGVLPLAIAIMVAGYCLDQLRTCHIRCDVMGAYHSKADYDSLVSHIARTRESGLRETRTTLFGWVIEAEIDRKDFIERRGLPGGRWSLVAIILLAGIVMTAVL